MIDQAVPPIDFAAVFERSPNAYMVVDRQLCFVAANRAYLLVTNKRLEDLIGRHVFDVFPHDPANPDNQSVRLVRGCLERVLRTGEADVLPLVVYRVPMQVGGTVVDEERFWSATHTPIVDGSGEVAFVLQHTVDVTELERLKRAAAAAAPPDVLRQQLEAGVLDRARQMQETNQLLDAERRALRQLIEEQRRQQDERATLLAREKAAREAAEAAEAHQRFLAESIPQQVWTAGPGGGLDFVNHRVLEYFGVPAESVLGGGWQDVVHPDDVPAALARWRHSLETGEEYEVEFRLRRFDGAYRWHLVRALAQCDADGAVIRWFGTNTDTDELKRARDLLHDRAAFEQQLIGIVSHDLRNPLNAISVGTALLLKRGSLDEGQEKVARRLLASSQRAAHLVRDFLDFTQARVSGRIPVNRVDTNVSDLAAQVFEEVQLMHPERAGRVEHSGEENAVVDPDRVSQLIANLVGNAFQHGGAGGSVCLTTTGTADEMVIEVANDGDPIAPDDLKRLFEPFERGAEAKATTARSIGLGLYIAKQIVVAHDGAIDVRSSEAGTAFTVRLPR